MKLTASNIRFRYPAKGGILRRILASLMPFLVRPAPSAAWILDGVTLDFEPGCLNILQGFSGSGKSTALKLLAGLLKPTTGSITAPSGRAVTDRRYTREEMGYVFQANNLLPNASVRRNIELAWAASGMSREEGREETERLLRFVGLEAYGDRAPETLSGGQQQRAGIARALAKRPRVLLMDEPTSGLDDENTERILQIIRDLPQTTVCVVATHDHRLIEHAGKIIRFPLA